jgi:RsiW-degrading membrane proteinase PrsW (M82 family)
VSSKSHATLRYTAMRAGIFAGCLVVVAVLAYVGIIPEGIGKSNPLWVVLIALVISAPLSYVLLRKQRDEMSAQLVEGVDRAKQRIAANQGQEDGAA